MTPPNLPRTVQRAFATTGAGIASLSRRPKPDPAAGTADWCRWSLSGSSGTSNHSSGVNFNVGALFNTQESTNSSIFQSGMTIKVLVAGLFLCKAKAQYQTYPGTLPGSIRELWVFRNGSASAVVSGGAMSPLDDFPMCTGEIRLEANDVLTLASHQDSGTTMTVYKGGDGQSTNPDDDGNYLELVYIPLPLGIL